VQHRSILPRAALLLAFAATGCGFRSEPATIPTGESARFGAALAHLTVDNRTEHRLSIAYRPAIGPGGVVGVGAVSAGERRRVAPIPAGEAIRLSARTGAGDELVLETRSFALGQEWVWEIPADAQFRPPTPR
jgi:hypothetical protein